MKLKDKRNTILEEMNKLTNKDLLSSLSNEHIASTNTQVLDRTTHSTGTPSLVDRSVSLDLKSAFNEADVIFASM